MSKEMKTYRYDTNVIYSHTLMDSGMYDELQNHINGNKICYE